MGTIDLNLLRTFLAVADAASFSLAAARLGAPKSSVSRALQRLEDELGVVLVHRTTRSVKLSTAGEAFRARVAPRLQELERSLLELPELHEQPAGELRVTASVDFGTAVLADVIARFVARHPEVRVDMHLTNAVVDVMGEGFDVALRISRKPLRDSELHARRIAPLAMGLFAAPSYLANRGAPRAPADLESHDWVAFGAKRHEVLIGGGREVKVAPRGRVRGDDMSFVRASLRAGAGVGVLPTFLADEDVVTGALVRVLPRWRSPSGTLYLVHPGGARLPRKLTAFRDFVLEALAARGFTRG